MERLVLVFEIICIYQNVTILINIISMLREKKNIGMIYWIPSQLEL